MNAQTICTELGITYWTLLNWYAWEKSALADGSITDNILPVPTRLNNQPGRPRDWTADDLVKLKEFQASIQHGRNGKMGKITNSNYVKKSKSV